MTTLSMRQEASINPMSIMDKAIDLLSVERAIRLTDYFKVSAISVQNILNENMLTAQQQAIVNQLPATFTTAQALAIAKENGMKSRTLERFLNDNIGILFRKEKHGEYSKIYS